MATDSLPALVALLVPLIVATLLPPALAQHSPAPATAPAAPAQATQTERFDIDRFHIVGNTLLPSAELEARIVEFTGKAREYGDIQRAVETLELAYRRRGYSAVQVYAPEQELTGGSVRLNVSEATIGTVGFVGDHPHFDEANLRAALPALREGTTPNAQDLSAQIALANENPAKQIEVVLGLGKTPNSVDARVKIESSDPLRVSLTLDNTGTEQTGRQRIGIAVQHANLWNRDHVATLAYQTSPEKPDKVDIYSVSYRLPVYAWAGAFDLILAKSTVNAGVTPTTAGDLAFAGSGTVFGLRYTQALAREGDTIRKLIVGWDRRAIDNTCTLGAFGATGCGAAAVDVTLRPVMLTYGRMDVAPGQATELSATAVTNIPGGEHGEDADFQAARPSPNGGTGARARYSLLRAALTHLRIFPGDWQARLVANGQWTSQALLAQEQIGLAGAGAVRGFLEREVARDSGVQLSLEGYTPNFAEAVGAKGNLRALAFLDAANGRNKLLDGEVQPKASLASWGLGLRYGAGKDVSAKLDVARVITANGAQDKGDWRGHFSLMVAF